MCYTTKLATRMRCSHVCVDYFWEKTHYSPKPLIIAERFRFHKRNQEEGESISQFVAVLKQLSEHCEFEHFLNDTIRDRLVCGMRSGAIQKRLLTESNLTLQNAIERV